VRLNFELFPTQWGCILDTHLLNSFYLLNFLNCTISRGRREEQMSWLPKEKATWGIILAIAAIILAFPLSLLANLITPKIRDWWAQRSVAALRARIAMLEQELAKRQVYELLPDGEESIMLTILRAGKAAIGFSGFLWGIATGAAAIHKLRLAVHFFLVGAFIFSLVAVPTMMHVLEPVRLCWSMRSARVRRQISENIARLSVKLARPRKSQ